MLAGGLAVTTELPHAVVLRRDPADLWPAPRRLATPSGRDPRVEPIDGRAAAYGAGARRDPLCGWLSTLGFAANTIAVVVVAVHPVPFLREQGHDATFAAVTTTPSSCDTGC